MREADLKDTKWASKTMGMTSENLHRVLVNSAFGDGDRVAATSGSGE
jgi:hypothetical protein